MSMNFIDPDDTSEPEMEFVPIAATEPQVIKVTNTSGSFYWSEVEAKAVPSSGDVTYYHSDASIRRVYDDLVARFGKSATFTIEKASILDDVTTARAPATRAPTDDDDDVEIEVTPEDAEFGVVEYDGGYGVDEDGEIVYVKGGVRLTEDDYEYGDATYAIRKPSKSATPSFGGAPFETGKFPFRQDADSQTILTSGARLRSIFGEPGDGNGWQVSTSWCVTFASGEKGVIYEDRQSETYEDGLLTVDEIRNDPAKLIEWTVSKSIAAKVAALL